MIKEMLCATVATAAALVAVPATAQTAPPEAPGPSGQAASQDSDIIVTARRVEENLQDVPLAVSAVSGASLQRQAIREVKDLSSTIPNLIVMRTNAGGSTILFSIRGQQQVNSGLLFIDPAVGVYVDGLNVPRSTGLRSGLVDIQRVEVLRGPQGTLYGRNTTGGAVGILTDDPKPEFGASIQASYGNFNAWSLLGVLNARSPTVLGCAWSRSMRSMIPMAISLARARGWTMRTAPIFAPSSRSIKAPSACRSQGIIFAFGRLDLSTLCPA